MPKEYFYLVPIIRQAEKYFEVSRQEICRELERCGEFGIEGYLDLIDEDEETVNVSIDLRISYKNGVGGWHIALLLHKIRVDGIDFEQRYTDVENIERNGWHRHVWNGTTKEADKGKLPLNDLDGVEGLEEFLIRCFQIMGINLNQVDHGISELPFD